MAATLVAAAAFALGAAQPTDVERHVAAARAAAGAEHAGMVDRLCPMTADSAQRPGGAPAPGGGSADPPRDSWHAEPQKVFDNLYFVGMTEFASWALTTTDGIIVIDPLFDYSVEDEVVGGLKKLGFDAADIRYVLISHGHLDHAGGAKLLQERFGARVLMSAADWDMVAREKPRWEPERDLVITDGEKLRLADGLPVAIGEHGCYAAHCVRGL